MTPKTSKMPPERAQAAMDELIKHGLAREIVVNGVQGIQLTDAGQVHAKRLLKQQRLGPEFEKVLYDNLWELYAR